MLGMPNPHAPRLWSPRSDQRWHALIPRSPARRQIGDLRRRMDAIFPVACASTPWKHAPEAARKPDAVARRLTRAGLAAGGATRPRPRHPLLQIRDVIFRACRRANRMLGVAIMALARRLGLVSALNGPPAWMPDPDMSETRTSQLAPAFERRDVPQMKRLNWPRRSTRGRRNIPRAMRMVWP